MQESNPTVDRLENQISWYDKRSNSSQICFKILKIIEIVLAALIPFASGLKWPAFSIGLFGVSIVIIEGLQSIFQFHCNWISYRSTCENLKHEKYLFLAAAGPYKEATDANVLLAERVETLVSHEHAKWISITEKAGRKEKK